VLTAGPTPRIDTAAWAFTIDGIVAEKQEWSWEELHELEFEDVPWRCGWRTCPVSTTTSASPRPTATRRSPRSRSRPRWTSVRSGADDCLDEGEVSPYFHDVVEVGDEVVMRAVDPRRQVDSERVVHNDAEVVRPARGDGRRDQGELEDEV